MSTTERKTYKVVEAAKVLGVSTPTMYELYHAKNGPPALFIGRRIVIPVGSFHEWINREAEKSRA